MTQETINQIILGATAILSAIVGIGGGLLVAWYSHRNEIQREKQKREWDLEVIKRNEKRDVYLKRIAQVEEYGTNVVNWANGLKDKFKDITDTKDKELLLKLVHRPEEFKKFLDNYYIRGTVNELDDEKLYFSLLKLMEEFVVVAESMSDIADLLKSNQEPVMDDYKNKFSKTSIVDAYGEFLKRVDYLRNNIDTLYINK